MNTLGKVAIGVVALGLLGKIVGKDESSTAAVSPTTSNLTAAATGNQAPAAAPVTSPYEGLDLKIKNFSPDHYPETADGILTAAAELADMRTDLILAVNDSAYAKVAKTWKPLLVKQQVKYYPVLRQKWAAIAKKTMWDLDIDVALSGAGSTVITFTGGSFAANKNKGDAQSAISDALNTLRFKQSRYKWYSGDDEYTYYKMDTPKDSDL